MSLLSVVLASLAMAAGPAGDEPDKDDATSRTPHPATTPSGPDLVYPAAFYAAFQPQTALDMLERTPGFTLSEGSSVRGFGGAAGNVLIDGQRPTVKAGGVTEVLRRIAVSRVERIQLLRGADAAEAQGQTLVANVVLKAEVGGSGNATLSLARTGDGRVTPSGRISHARAIGGWQANVELSAEVVRYPSHAVYEERDTAGALVRTRKERIAAKAPEYGLALSGSRPAAGGALTVNLRLNGDGYQADRSIDLYAGAAKGLPDSLRTIVYEEKGKSAELGLDWTRALRAGWTTKLVGLGRVETSTTDEDFTEPGRRGLSSQREKPLELVGRGVLTREGERRIRPELGVEVAYNRLTSQLDYAEDRGAGLVPVALSNADTRVAELRGEAFANVTARLVHGFNLEAGIAVERSRIEVSGETPSEQSLTYFKPSAALVWSPAENTQLRLGVRRTVDQLDFADFAASVDQADGRPLGGNVGLRPARMTRALVRLDHRWGKGGAFVAEAWRQWHDGLLGYLLLPSGDEALGTIGDARQSGLTVQTTLPLDAVVRGARLTLDGTLRTSRFKDPITGAARTMDDLAPRSLSAEFRQDLPRLRSSWGVNYTAAKRADIFYIGEVLSWRNRPFWGAYVETRALAGFKTTLLAESIGGKRADRLRRFYSPTRTGAFSGSEARDQRQGAVVTLTLARSL